MPALIAGMDVMQQNCAKHWLAKSSKGKHPAAPLGKWSKALLVISVLLREWMY